MAENIYDEVEIEDFTWDPTLQIYHYPCPCGDRFEIGLVDLQDGEDIAVCPSCSLMVRVIFDAVGIIQTSSVTITINVMLIRMICQNLQLQNRVPQLPSQLEVAIESTYKHP
jgi:diphthamide biosynthesis protein 3